MHRSERGFVEVAAPDARLVRDDDESSAEVAELTKARGGVRQQLEPVRVREVVLVHDDRAVAVEEDGEAHALRSRGGFAQTAKYSVTTWLRTRCESSITP